jgi:hypothetical protein
MFYHFPMPPIWSPNLPDMKFWGIYSNNYQAIVLPSTVVHSCNPALRRPSQEDCQSEANLGYIAGSCLKVKQQQQQQKNPKITTPPLKSITPSL